MLDFQNVYQNVPETVAAGLKTLWTAEGALSDDLSVRKRLEEVVYAVVDSDNGQVAAVSTAVKKKVNPLNGNFLYEFRCYVGEAYRIAGLDVKLSRLTFDFLEQLASRDADKPIGIFTVLGNDFLKAQPVWRRAVWPEIDIHFIGYNKNGDPIRVHYFKGARI
ncbi:MAG TPA: hypothetical protein PK325_09555 [Cyclobacteriaceae bacterium]|nr:hypothetical protein [Cyclobacteriaceae bacterium]HMV10769.1 hypothetical protein [Cyclobacteriaceae bacterium]HMV91478.1 hypothetical protein [Cyclobacteriaceae bacterium]HMX01649.1 hypothetical protein [Cyclobacteriaceae bacterium]HMX50657.1 hypothetical protein [Cyclobacteriaceae bacterium]